MIGHGDMHVYVSAPPKGDRGAEDEGKELDWLGGAPWAKVALIITVAIFVLSVGGYMTRTRRTRRGRRRPNFDLEVAHMDSLPVAGIASAKSGPVHFEGEIVSTTEGLGGKPGRERVYFNKATGSRATAVASDMITVADATGQVGVDSLDTARVIAPRDSQPDRPKADETICLYVGDRVQLLGHFDAEQIGDDDDPSKRVYGMLGTQSQVQIRVLERAPDPDAPTEAAVDDGDSPPSASQDAASGEDAAT